MRLFLLVCLPLTCTHTQAKPRFAVVVPSRELPEVLHVFVNNSNSNRSWGTPSATWRLPVFVKLHKVGGTTLADLFECLAHLTDVMPPDLLAAVPVM